MSPDVLAHYWTKAQRDAAIPAQQIFPKQASCTGADAPLPAGSQPWPGAVPSCSRGTGWQPATKADDRR